MNQRTLLGYALVVLGLTTAFLASIADTLGLDRTAGFGIGQLAALVAGFLLLIAGIYIIYLSDPYLRIATAEGEIESPRQAAAAEEKHDDLTRIEGIGPKLQKILYQAGFTSYTALCNAEPHELTQIVRDAGFNAPVDTETWPEQAKLAAQEKWDELEQLQQKLDGGSY